MESQVFLEALWSALLELGQSALGPALGALFGAGAALKLEKWREARIQRKARGLELTRARFVLSHYKRALKILQDEYLSPLEDDPDRWRKLDLLFSSPSSMEVELNSLVFLIDLGRQDLLVRILQCQQKVSTVLMTLEQRNLAKERVGDTLNTLRSHPNLQTSRLDAGMVDDLLGPALLDPLRGLTDALYQGVPETLALVTQTESEVQDLLASEYLLPVSR